MNLIFEFAHRCPGKFSRDVLKEDFRTGLKDLDGGYFPDAIDFFLLTC